MKTFGLALLAAFLWYAVMSTAATVWDEDMAARETLDRCLAFGGTPSQCEEMTR